jgi:type II secretory pathway component PulC
MVIFKILGLKQMKSFIRSIYQQIISLLYIILWLQVSDVYAQNASPTTQSTTQSKTANCIQITQSEKSQFFKKGPQALIAGIRVLPVFKEEDRKRFLGFKIDQILDDSILKGGIIKEGDVILNLNGEPIGRPEHFMKAWDTAKKSKKITLEIQRDSEKQSYHWCILE